VVRTGIPAGKIDIERIVPHVRNTLATVSGYQAMKIRRSLTKAYGGVVRQAVAHIPHRDGMVRL